jgi:radical SAM protein with 4Fe4S-binding SPASM domain
MSLLAEMNQKALGLGIPISVHLDITYRCNERCVHCYLDHDDHGEMTTSEIKDVLTQLSEAGVFFLTLSGGEVLMRRDFFEIVEHARRLLFNVKVKTNGVMIHEKEAKRIRELGVEQVQISVYSHRPEVHDAITKLPGSLKRTIEAIRFLKSQGLKVVIANVLMASNLFDNTGVMALAKELEVSYTLDPTITPKMDGDTSILALRIPGSELKQVFRSEELVGNVEEFCAPPPAPGEDIMEGFPCSAGHTACYITPYGDVFPCVQFPLPSGNLRQQTFLDIWHNSSQLKEVRSIRARDLPTCSTCAHVGTCTRCPGLAYMEGNMRGPSTADCEKSFQRTGTPTANMLARGRPSSTGPLIQIS